jgi:hypothetical protein
MNLKLKLVSGLSSDTEFAVTYHLDNETTGLEGIMNIKSDELSFEHQEQIMDILNAHIQGLGMTQLIKKLSHQ